MSDVHHRLLLPLTFAQTLAALLKATQAFLCKRSPLLPCPAAISLELQPLKESPLAKHVALDPNRIRTQNQAQSPRDTLLQKRSFGSSGSSFPGTAPPLWALASGPSSASAGADSGPRTAGTAALAGAARSPGTGPRSREAVEMWHLGR